MHVRQAFCQLRSIHYRMSVSWFKPMILVIYYCFTAKRPEGSWERWGRNPSLQVEAWPALGSSILMPAWQAEGRELDCNSTWCVLTSYSGRIPMQRKTCHSSKNVKSENKTKQKSRSNTKSSNTGWRVLGLIGLKEIFLVSIASIMWH